jgi:chromate transporter
MALTLQTLGLFFLKVGAVLYGSGYVLVAFLEGDLVERWGWLTSEQLLDAIAIGQMTPGPLLTTATFIGYLLLGVPGALVATVGVFLPSVVLVGLLNPVVAQLRSRPWSRAFLDSVNAVALGLMAAVIGKLAVATLTDWQAWLIVAASGVAVFRWRIHSAWLVAAAAVAGFVLRWVSQVG